MTTPMTSTKRKAISREMAQHDGMVVPHAKLMAIANRHDLSHADTRKLLSAIGYVVSEPVTAAEAMPGTEMPPMVIPAEVIATILRGSIYKVLDKDPDVDPSEVFVITTLDKFTKERAAIRKLLKGGL